MNPDLLLGIVSALAGFILKTTVAFAVCFVLGWLAHSPSRRFIVWLGFLYAATAYWLWMANGLFRRGQLHVNTSGAAVQPGSSVTGALQIPGSWAFPLSLALRGIGIAYLLVLTYILFIHFKKQRQLKWILRFTTKPAAEIEMTFQAIAGSLGVHRARLLILSGVASPATFGWVRPTILLPELCLQQDHSELEDVLRHELHHVRRRDFVWNGFAVICRALLFFHPAAWYAVRKIQFDRELACDLAVVSDSPDSRAKYAECLVHFARLNSSQDPRAWGIDFAASSEHLQVRVRSILARPSSTSVWLFGMRSVLGLILLGGFVWTAPSLAVLLSYSHRPLPQTLTPMSITPHLEVGAKVHPRRKARLSASLASTAKDALVGDLGQTETVQPIQPLAMDKTEGGSSQQNRPGLQLLRRGTRSANAPSNGTRPNQQSVVLVDNDPSGQPVKAGDHDKKEAIQQSLTAAAGVYRRLGAVDRH
jgi:beta-lactamase regulating signal transducer with metallopeptidase domain